MPTEIERKFLVSNDSWRTLGTPIFMRQGYISSSPQCTVRVREVGGRGFLTIKGASDDGISRSEYEYEIPLAHAQSMLDTLTQGKLISKTRTKIPFQGHIWEVDAFEGDNDGLVVAEIELSSPDEPFARPSWIGREVSFEPRFTNAALSRRPYCQWSDEEKI